MKHWFSLFLYYLGDVISRTIMQWGNGFGYSIYRQIMLWSCELDNEGRIWKYVKPRIKKRKKTKR